MIIHFELLNDRGEKERDYVVDSVDKSVFYMLVAIAFRRRNKGAILEDRN